MWNQIVSVYSSEIRTMNRAEENRMDVSVASVLSSTPLSSMFICLNSISVEIATLTLCCFFFPREADTHRKSAFETDIEAYDSSSDDVNWPDFKLMDSLIESFSNEKLGLALATACWGSLGKGYFKLANYFIQRPGMHGIGLLDHAILVAHVFFVFFFHSRA
jgi:hypothetical protein